MNPFVIAFRRIIYSIPLKRLLVGLAVFSVLLASFSSAIELDGRIVGSYVTDGNGFGQIGAVSNYDFICLKTTTSSCSSVSITDSVDNSVSASGNPYNNLICLKYDSSHLLNIQSNQSCIFGVLRLDLESAQESICEPMSSLECQTEYNLIPIESVDQQYCENNNLCPTYDCPTNPIGTGSLSNLYINNILHIGAPNIIMNIPEEIDWDYAYTMGGNTMNIDIFGYNQDYEKIEDWIYTNNYKPSSDDFTNIFTNFSNFGGLLIGALFVILVFYFVKKMFK